MRQLTTPDDPHVLPPTLHIQTAERVEGMQHAPELSDFMRLPQG